VIRLNRWVDASSIAMAIHQSLILTVFARALETNANWQAFSSCFKRILQFSGGLDLDRSPQMPFAVKVNVCLQSDGDVLYLLSAAGFQSGTEGIYQRVVRTMRPAPSFHYADFVEAISRERNQLCCTYTSGLEAGRIAKFFFVKSADIRLADMFVEIAQRPVLSGFARFTRYEVS
jgi:hypothetical protein